MTIEEKAKAYDEAIERANKIDTLNKEYLTSKEAKEYIFPELAESEDEKIRKAIISFLEQSGYGGVGEYPKAKMIAWLEKQKEQKPAILNKEDERIMNEIIGFLQDGIWHDDIIEKVKLTQKYVAWLSWLKSLRPQSHWKPSEEQMNALAQSIFMLGSSLGEDKRKSIESLYNDLKKLM